MNIKCQQLVKIKSSFFSNGKLRLNLTSLWIHFIVSINSPTQFQKIISHKAYNLQQCFFSKFSLSKTHTRTYCKIEIESTIGKYVIEYLIRRDEKQQGTKVWWNQQQRRRADSIQITRAEAKTSGTNKFCQYFWRGWQQKCSHKSIT